MNCKPGDLAVTTHPSMSVLVAVMHAAPEEAFILPDGELHGPALTQGPRWVCESMGQPLPTSDYVNGRAVRVNRRYVVIADRWLRPIRDNDGEDEMIRIAGKPVREVA